jgi:hypothetical protein
MTDALTGARGHANDVDRVLSLGPLRFTRPSAKQGAGS